MLRAFVLLLILANLGFLAWGQGWLRVLGTGPVPQAEPHRLTQQLRPEAIRVLPDAPSASPAPAAAEPAAGPPPAGQ